MSSRFDPEENLTRKRPTFKSVWFILFVAAGFIVLGQLRSGGPKLPADVAYDRMQSHELVIIDVRDPSEWLQTGLGRGVIPISMHRLDGVEGFIDAVKREVDGRLDAPVAVICATGNRSRAMQYELQDAGFTEVYDISEGMLGNFSQQGWIERGLPMDRL